MPLRCGILSYTNSNISRIETIQRRATKFILKSFYLQIFVRLRKLRLLSLEDRRFIAVVVLYVKPPPG